MKIASLLLTTAGCLLVLEIPSADAHGYMSVPISRNVLSAPPRRSWWPSNPNAPPNPDKQSLNAGGRRTNDFVYPETITSALGHGLCGDPALGPKTCWSGGKCEEQHHMPGGKYYTAGKGGGAIQATYLEGQQIDVTFTITAHHSPCHPEMPQQISRPQTSCLREWGSARCPTDQPEIP